MRTKHLPVVLIAHHSFGWVNASYVVGLSVVNVHMRRALGALTPYETFAKATHIQLDELNLVEKSEESSSGVGSSGIVTPEESPSDVAVHE